jgi:tripartite-type tricarboxylate transporter receptor subunit TctC
MKPTWIFLAAAFAAAALLAKPAAAQTESFPSRTVKIVVPVAAGGLKDLQVRWIANGLEKIWKQPVIVENRTGAAHIIATEYVANSAPDGYTILATDKPWTANPFLYKKLPYDGVNALVPLANYAEVTSLLVASTQTPFSSLEEMVAFAKANPSKLNYGSFGIGSVTHTEMEALAFATGTKFTHIVYKGVADVVPALLRNEIQIALTGVPPVISFVQQGSLKALAYGGKQRSRLLPNVPTFAEAGLNFESGSWSGLLVPAGTPQGIINKIAADIRTVLATTEVREQFDRTGGEMFYLGPDDFKKLIDDDRKKFGALAQKIGLKPE